MTKILSIIIPCYNCEKTLEEAVKSCYTQNLTIPYEIILVNDGSTDGTQKVTEQICQKYPYIKCIAHDKNMGGGAARNSGIKNSTGTHIFCLDSDDILPQGTLEKMVRFITEKECDGVAIHQSIKFKGNNVNNIEYVGVSPFLTEKIGLENILKKEISFVPIYVNFLYTRRAFDKTGGYPTTHGYDTQGFAWRFLCAGLNIYTCQDTTYLQRVHFNDSYFIREYNAGKMNYNWREILLEHYYVFTADTLNFIRTFNCQDFSKNILVELINRNDILKKDYARYFGTKPRISSGILEQLHYIKRDSLKGYYFRIKHRLKHIKTQIDAIRISSIFTYTYKYLYSIFTSIFIKHASKADFNKIYQELKQLYIKNITQYSYFHYVTAPQQTILLNMEKKFLDSFSFSFLNDPLIKNTVLVPTFNKFQNIQKSLISNFFSRLQAIEILREHDVGRPQLNDFEYATSSNNINHLYHITKFFKETGTEAADHATVVEIGGGYGNMAKIYKKLNSSSTYIIIDIPIFSYIQALYLKTIYGKDVVHIVHNRDVFIRKGLINIIPLDKKIMNLLGKMLPSVDLFMSTWALSESNIAMQNYIQEQDYFKAKYLLLAYQKAENTQHVTRPYTNIFNKNTEHVEDSNYLIWKRT